MYNATAGNEKPEKRANASFFYYNGRHILLGGGGRTKEYNDLWSLDYEKENRKVTWKKIPHKGAISYTPRTGQAATLCGNKAFIFGGQNFHDGKMYGEGFLYDIENNTWETLTNKDKPSERNSCTVVFDAKRNRVILVGGADLSGPLNDIYSFDLEKNTWQALKPQGTLKPVGREMHGAVIFHGKLEFPNIQVEPPTKQEKTIDLNFTSGFEQIEQVKKEEGQEAAEGTQAENTGEKEEEEEKKVDTQAQPVKNEEVGDEGSYLLIFGGRHREEFSKEILCLNLETLEWKYLGNMPFTICAHSCELADDKVFVFGGTDGMQFLDNLYYYDLKTREWFIYKRGKKDNLQPRIAASTSYNPDKKEILIFGGCSYEDELNDVKMIPVNEEHLKKHFQKLKI